MLSLLFPAAVSETRTKKKIVNIKNIKVFFFSLKSY